MATTGDGKDWATSMLPKLMYERLDEFGIDFMMIYPSLGIGGINLPDPELRRLYCRAYNTMTSDLFAPYQDRITPAAIIPTYSPRKQSKSSNFASRSADFASP